MEPTNHPFRKENDLNQTSMELWSMLIFQGVRELDWTLQGAEAASDFEKRRPVGVICTADSCGKVCERWGPLGICGVKMEGNMDKNYISNCINMYEHV